MTLLRVERFLHHSDCEIGRVFLKGKFFCFSIEDAHRTTKIKGETCIPCGKYPLALRWSPKFSSKYNHEMIWVKNVPNYEYILIHWGNTICDTEGCLIVGDKIGIINEKESVLNSKATYIKLYNEVINEIKGGGQFIEYITI